MKCGGKRMCACSIFADRGKIDGKFLFAVNAEELVTSALIVGGNGTTSRIDALASQIEILADMTGINGNYLMGSHVITPLHARWNSRPEKVTAEAAIKF